MYQHIDSLLARGSLRPQHNKVKNSSALPPGQPENSLHTKLGLVGALLLAGLFGIAAWSSATPFPDDQDGVNFAFGVENFHLASHRPHFPGYPVYIVLGKGLQGLFAQTELALCFLSVVSGVAALIFIYLMTRRTAGVYLAWFCVLALAANPVFFAFSQKIYTEIFALALLLATFWLLMSEGGTRRRQWFLAGSLQGLLLGVRLSWWPFPLVLLLIAVHERRFRHFFSGLVFCGLLWFVGELVYVGPVNFFETGWSFVTGHFTEWGGALTSLTGVEHPLLSFGRRLASVWAIIGPDPTLMQLPWLVCIAVGLLAILRWRLPRYVWWYLAANGVYCVWLLFGQNLAKDRHFLPLVPALILILASVVRRFPGLVAAGVLALVLYVPSYHTMRTHKTPPAARLHQWLNAQGESGWVVYCGETERFFDRYPLRRVVMINVRFWESINDSISATWPPPERVLVCDDIPGFVANAPMVQVFPARYGDPVDRTLRIYAGPAP